MKRALKMVVAAFWLAGFTGSVHAGEPLYYDAERQALAVDPYFDGWGGKIDIDFDADHSWASPVWQNVWHYLYGDCTDVGIYHAVETALPKGATGLLTRYTWGERLGTLAPAFDYSSFIEAFHQGDPTFDKVHYFTDEWNVAAGRTTLYVRPVSEVSGVDIPVRWSDLDSIYFRINGGEWRRFTDVYEPPALAAGLRINPETLNLKSSGRWITVHIIPPEGYSAAEVDTAAVRLSVEAVHTLAGQPVESLLYRAGPPETVVGRTGKQLMLKFDRSGVSELLSPGEATLVVSGRLADGHTFRGSDSIRVK